MGRTDRWRALNGLGMRGVEALGGLFRPMRSWQDLAAMRRFSTVVFLACAAAVAVAPGCRRGQRGASQQQGGAGIAYGLGSDDAEKREDAAKELRDDGGPPAAAVPHLLTALQREPDENARREMLITLGASGAPDAKPVLESYLRHPNDEAREGAEKGLVLWSKKNGQALPSHMKEIALLGSPDWKERREAADDLRDDGGPPKEAVGPLVTAAGREQHPKALVEMLLTLGASGAPEAKPVIEAHVESPDNDVRRYARKAQKTWKTKNGQAVRKDIETPTTAPPAPIPTGGGTTAAAAPAKTNEPAPAPAPDGCDQFKGICGADPFAVDKCRADMKPLSHTQQVAWADCVNSSTAACQKAHDSCMVKAKAAK